MSAAQQPEQQAGTPVSGPAQRLEVAGRWLADAGGRATPGEIGAALGLNGARQAEVVGALRRQGLVEGPRLQVHLTTAGWTRFALPAGEQAGAGEALEAALDGWPQRPRAFVELLVAAVIARHHLAAVRPSGHLGFMALGPTGTGKSSAGQAVCHLFGWDPVAHELYTPAETTGSLLGRRVQSTAGYAWDPAPTTRLPIVVLDEFDKADEPVQRAAFRILMGKVPQLLEGQVVDFLPTPLLTANPPTRGDRYARLPQAARRRCVVWDTADLAGRGPEIGRRMKALERHLGQHPRHRLHLDRLRPPQVLSEEASALLESTSALLTDAGREEFDVPPLEAATLGRCALMGEGADDVLAAVATVVAYLQVTESRPGQVVPDWPAGVAALREHLGEGADVERLMAALRRGSSAQQAAQDAVRQGRQRAARAELGVLEEGAALAERLRLAREGIDGRKVPTERKAEAAGLRRVLGTLRTSASQVSTAAALTEVRERALGAGGPLERAEQLARDLTAQVAQREQDARTARDAERLDRRAAAGQRQSAAALARSRRQLASEQLREVVELARRLEKLYARTTTRDDERPLVVLAAVVVHGQPLLTYVPAQPEPAPEGTGTGLRQRMQLRRHQQEQERRGGTWRALPVAGAPGVAFEGWPGYCTALQSWGSGTRAVLRPTLLALHDVEDHLRAAGAGGGRARARPDLVEPAPPPRALPPGPLGARALAAAPVQRRALPVARRP